jgi:hypothetical protein
MKTDLVVWGVEALAAVVLLLACPTPNQVRGVATTTDDPSQWVGSS